LLAALATLALEFAREPYTSRPWLGWGTTAVAFVTAVAASLWLRRRQNAKQNTAPAAVALIGGMALAPFVGAVIARRVWLVGESPEIVQLVGVRNLMLALAAAAVWPGALRLSSVLSLFLALGALMFMSAWPGYFVILIYGVVGIWWLMGAHWQRLQGRFADVSRREIPRGVAAGSIAALLVAVGIAALTLGGVDSTVALDGVFWGSGGTGAADPFAARGVHDGDQLVAARHEAASFGAVESELFLDSDMPSLYDMFNDMYGEPVRPKHTERAIGLAASPDPPAQQRIAESRSSGREFAAVRHPPRRRPAALQDQDHRALIYVGGRVPLHLRMETFDSFDGRVWSHAEDGKSLRSNLSLRMDSASGKPWCEINWLQESAALCQPELHVVKVIGLSTNRIPTPAHLVGVHIDKVDQREFYEWTDDDALAMPDRERIPPLQVIHIRSRSIDPEKLSLTKPLPGAAPAYLATNNTASVARIEKLTQQWIAGAPRGYPQVAAIVTRLRSGEFVLDSSAIVPADCEDAAEHFLFHTQGGPDYLFATSAAVMLRSAGYPARVATGLYANPARYDRLTGQTPILESDIHFWVEVCLDDHTWITVEPTPGYEILPPKRTWAEAAAFAVRRFALLIQRYPFTAAGLLLAAALAALYRREIASTGCTLVWLSCQFRPARGRLLATIWLIERRAAIAGRGRPPHATLASWYTKLARNCSQPTQDTMEELLRAATWALYAPAGAPAGSVAPLCHRAARALTLRSLGRMPLPHRDAIADRRTARTTA
jgi:transglutaminase-like putative cysteine protease